MTNGTGPSFLMGENSDVLHIITTWWDENGINHQLNNLREADDETLAIIATLPNDEHPTTIGKPGEMIYATRYIGDRAYVVTYQQIDPLYVIDLSDPEQPTIAGELEIPGYSSYLHAVNDELLLGIGKETVLSDSGNFAWFKGLKLSLFDVADIANPQEIQVLTIGERGTDTPLLNDHHALSYLHGSNGDPDRFTLPIRFHEGTTSGYASAYHDWQYNGLFLFEIDEGEAVNLRHQGTITSATAESDDNAPYQGSDRAIIQGSAVHYLHDNNLTSADWDAVTP